MSEQKPPFPRVLLKLSGEALSSSKEGRALDIDTIHTLARQLAEGTKAGVQIALVIGGGNLWRGGRKEGLQLERTASDVIGMLGTIMNSVAFGQVLGTLGTPVRVMSAIGPSPWVERYNIRMARRALDEGEVVLLAGGTSNPFFTTDSAAALRALELQADAVFKATNVDGIYSDDPRSNPDATLYENLSYDEAIEKNLRVMDTAAFSLCRDGNIPIFVFNMQRPQGIRDALLGQGPGTRVDQQGG
jgi:uridylate kinase